MKSKDPIKQMITLKTESLNWLDTTNDCPTDLCAHGTVQFTIDDLEIVVPTDEWTVSAATIYLLRSLERDHPFDNIAGGPLFP